MINQSQKFTSEKKILVNERFYKDTPNGVIPSFLESKKTEILSLANNISEQYNLLYLPINAKTTEDKNLLIEKYLLKETYWIGDPIEIEFLNKKQDTLKVWVNEKEIIGEINDLNKIRFSWLAKKSGIEKVRIRVNNETFEYLLKIEKPKLLFQGNIKSLHGSIDDSIIVNLNKNKIDFNKIKIKCSFAEVLIKNNQLLVIPKSSGNFELDIFYKNSKIQSIPVFINDMTEIEVFTANNNFENSRKDIRRLICKDSKKEVFAFNCIIVSDGIKKEKIENLSSAFNSRLLKAINQTKSGDIIIFEKIRIKDSFLNSELTGKPIVIKQSK
jgi:hypothetical protein